MTDTYTRQLERLVLQGDRDALGRLRSAYVREGLEPEVRYWILTSFPISVESEPCVFKRNGETACGDRSWRTPVRTLDEVMDLYRRLSEPVPSGHHHNRTCFTVFDTEEGRVVNVVQGMGDSVGRELPRHTASAGLLAMDAFGKHGGHWCNKTIHTQAAHVARLKKAVKDHAGDVPWEWFVREIQWHSSRPASDTPLADGLEPDL